MALIESVNVEVMSPPATGDGRVSAIGVEVMSAPSTGAARISAIGVEVMSAGGGPDPGGATFASTGRRRRGRFIG